MDDKNEFLNLVVKPKLLANPIFDLKRYTTTGQLVDQSEASISSGILIGQSNYLHHTQSCNRDQSFVAEFMQRFVHS